MVERGKWGLNRGKVGVKRTWKGVKTNQHLKVDNLGFRNNKM